MSRPPRLVCRWVPDPLEHYTAMLDEATGYDGGVPPNDEVRVILTDLINLMRDCAALTKGSALSRAMHKVLDNAEARLREVDG